MKKIVTLFFFQCINMMLAKAQFVTCESMPLEIIAQEAKLKDGFGAVDSVITIPIINNTTTNFAYPLSRLVELTPLPPGMTYHGGNQWQVFASAWNVGDTTDAYIEFDVAQPIPANYSVTFKMFVSNFSPLTIDSCQFSNTLTVNLNPVVSIRELNSGSDWKIYPNPAMDYIDLQLTETFEEEVELVNCQGEIISRYILENNKKRISISELSNGIYFVKLKRTGAIKKLCILK